ncbi:hypothetical protein [Aquibium microcysteis]|uniref:hypothetical protein n=1 Tax=Aquibium microcysteis TaxID=675281 RepID=UPI00165D101C|nr:hypothetical protein [Aquibium microcysteis]
MGRVLLVAVAWGLAGMMALPLILHVSIVGLSHLLDPHCAGTGMQTECGTGAFGIALASVVPSFALFFLLGVVSERQRLRRRAARDFEAVLDDPGAGGPDRD